jgi:hypothetical protein
LDGSASIIALKVVGTPLVIGLATLAGRRWGPTVSGWIGGLPLASGPLTYFLTVEQGAAFGSASATATLAGLVAVAAFAVAFSRLAAAGAWPLPLSVGVVTFVVAAGAMVFVPMPPMVAFVAAVAALTAAILLLGSPLTTVEPKPAPAWDIPARASVATTMVIGLSAAAANLGPRLVGLIAPFPVYASVMASFAHAHDGPAVSVRLLRGVLVGAYGFACFYLIVALLVTDDVLKAFAGATLTALAVQAASMWAIRRLAW